MLGLDPSIPEYLGNQRPFGLSFSGRSFASPENDASSYAASPRFASNASGVGRRPRKSV
ncbi:hypothetical protein SAMN05880592_102156 [Bosea sp. TND4EK4]|nr:hypothetical protein SAMN05880592_102156 [Bosea sp. TND4EK4]